MPEINTVDLECKFCTEYFDDKEHFPIIFCSQYEHIIGYSCAAEILKRPPEPTCITCRAPVTKLTKLPADARNAILQGVDCAKKMKEMEKTVKEAQKLLDAQKKRTLEERHARMLASYETLTAMCSVLARPRHHRL